VKYKLKVILFKLDVGKRKTGCDSESNRAYIISIEILFIQIIGRVVHAGIKRTQGRKCSLVPYPSYYIHHFLLYRPNGAL
jgi:hypothetical protein